MRFLIVAERELRAAARRRGTYRARWITAALFFALLVWLIWAFDGFQNRRAAPGIFQAFSVLTFIYCIIIGTATTADCLSAERRDGTLGLLFLTNLNSAEIVAGKFLSSALSAVYGLMAIFPMLALPMLMGGVTGEHFWKTILALIVTIFFSLASGFVSTVLCRKQFTAIAFSMGLAFAYGAGLMLAVSIMGRSAWKISWRDELAAFCPLYALNSADGGSMFGKNHFWFSLLAVVGVSSVWLALVTWRLARTWRDQPKSRSLARHFPTVQRLRQSGGTGRKAFRRRLLDINPFFWLGGRKQISSPVFMCLAVVVVAFTTFVTRPFFSAMFSGQAAAPMFGLLMAWGWTGLGLYLMASYYAAMAASQRLAEDKQTGALELILSTPTTEQIIARGLWLAYGRRIFFPALLAVLVHFFFVWQLMTLFVLEPDGNIPGGLTAWQLFRVMLFNGLINGRPIEWGFVFGMRCLLLIMPMLLAVWVMLGWVGRWLGLRMKHPGFAPLVAVALAFVPPVILFSVSVYLFAEFKLYRLPDHQIMPLMMWITAGIVGGHCLLLSFWAARHLRRDFRTIVMNRYQPPPARLTLRGGLRMALHLGGYAIGMVLILALIIFGFFGHQSWSSRSAWRTFQKEMKQKGESLEVARLLPAPASDAENFARSPAFKSMFVTTNKATLRWVNNLQQFDIANTAYGNTQVTMEWISQKFSPLDDAAQMFEANPKQSGAGKIPPIPRAQKSKPAPITNRLASAAAILEGLQPHAEMLRGLAAASRLPRFQVSTNGDAAAVLFSSREEFQRLERAHFLFQLRACALLANNRAPEAAEDLLTGLRLAGLARQSPDARSAMRTQIMLARSLQPLWEGLASHQWNETQLAEFQNALAGFDLLSDYTNAVHRVVIAQIERWRAIPANEPPPTVVRGGPPAMVTQQPWTPRAWWFDNCIQLYRAGENAIENVDVARGRVQTENNWRDLSGLTLDSETQQLLQQNNWWGPNAALVSFAQNAVNQAVIACALERYFLSGGKYPDNLEQLVPAYLGKIPNDIVRGRAMTYQGKVRDRYILRGVGSNETDDRKLPVSDDWLWAYPTNAPSRKK